MEPRLKPTRIHKDKSFFSSAVKIPTVEKMNSIINIFNSIPNFEKPEVTCRRVFTLAEYFFSVPRYAWS